MATPSEAFLQKRVSVGAALASLATLLVFLIWRIAAIFDAGLGANGWLWLGFEAALLLFVLPLVAVLYCVLGVVLVRKGSGPRKHQRRRCALAGGVVGGIAGLALASIGLFDIEQGGVLNSTMAGLAAMIVSGMAGGFVGHAGWFPAPSITE